MEACSQISCLVQTWPTMEFLINGVDEGIKCMTMHLIWSFLSKQEKNLQLTFWTVLDAEAISTGQGKESRPGRLSQPSLSNLRESCKGRRYHKVADNFHPTFFKP